MTEIQYKTTLRAVLNEHSKKTITRLNLIFSSLPEGVQEMEIGIHPDQDGEGTFDVRVHLDGPDQYALNKSIEHCADLFEVKHTQDGLVPNVPLMDPFDCEFEVNDALCDVVSEWLLTVWHESECNTLDLPVTIFGDDGYGSKLPIKLN